MSKTGQVLTRLRVILQQLTSSPLELKKELESLVDYLEDRCGETIPKPIPMRLVCEGCGQLHIDEGEFATKPHHTHSCQHCGMTWRPAVVHTVGVRFLPGFKNDDEPIGWLKGVPVTKAEAVAAGVWAETLERSAVKPAPERDDTLTGTTIFTSPPWVIEGLGSQAHEQPPKSAPVLEVGSWARKKLSGDIVRIKDFSKLSGTMQCIHLAPIEPTEWLRPQDLVPWRPLSGDRVLVKFHSGPKFGEVMGGTDGPVCNVRLELYEGSLSRTTWTGPISDLEPALRQEAETPRYLTHPEKDTYIQKLEALLERITETGSTIPDPTVQKDLTAILSNARKGIRS